MQKLREKAEAVLNDRSRTSDDVPKQDDGEKPGKGFDSQGTPQREAPSQRHRPCGEDRQNCDACLLLACDDARLQVRKLFEIGGVQSSRIQKDIGPTSAMKGAWLTCSFEARASGPI